MDLSETDREIEITVKESDIQRNVGRMFWRSAVKRRASAKRPRRTIILLNAAMLHSPEPYNRRKAGHRQHQAVMSKGVLKVTAPKPVLAQTRKIEIKAAA